MTDENNVTPVNDDNTLAVGEPHPAARDALNWIAGIPIKKLLLMREAMASCAIEGNRTASICGHTLERLLEKQGVSDRYVLGLAWYLRHVMEIEHEEPDMSDFDFTPADKGL